MVQLNGDNPPEEKLIYESEDKFKVLEVNTKGFIAIKAKYHLFFVDFATSSEKIIDTSLDSRLVSSPCGKVVAINSSDSDN